MKIYHGKNGNGIYCSNDHGPWFYYAIGACNSPFLKAYHNNQYDLKYVEKYWNNFNNEYELTGGKKNF